MFDPEYLISFYFHRNDDFTQEHLNQLSKWIQQSPENAKRFVHAAFFHQSVLNSLVADDIQKSGFYNQGQDFTDAKLWELLAEEEKTAPAIEISEEKPQDELIQKVVYPPREQHKMSKFSIFTLVMSAAAMLFLVLFAKFAPRPVPRASVSVATVTDQMNVKWGSDTAVRLQRGDRLWTGDGLIDLSQGVVSIAYDQGVDAVIEGPAIFEIERSGIYLKYGRIYSRVSSSGLGFTVRTPTSQYTDLGTEFGVQAGVDTSSELQVFKGKVQLFAGSGDNPKTSQTVTQDNIAKYDPQTNQVRVAQLTPETTKPFAKKINSGAGLIIRRQITLDVADIVCKGNGFGTGSESYYLDPATGGYYTQRSEKDRHPFPKQKLHPVPENPLINCVFVPDGGQDGRIVISTTGLIFDSCPKTTGGFVDYIQRTELKDWRQANDSSPLGIGTNRSAYIYMHSNIGITLDLRAVRKSFPDNPFDIFRTQCAITSKPEPESYEIQKECRAVFHFLIDGKEMVRVPMKTGDMAEPVEIKIAPEDSFLTFMVTDGGDTNYGDRTYFLEPRLAIANAE